MVLTCCKCKSTPNIKISILLYCNNCFLSMFESKALRNITKIRPSTRICVFLNESSISIVLYDLIAKFFENRPFKEVVIYCKNRNIFSANDRFSFLDSNLLDFDFETLTSNKALDWIKKEGFDIFVYPEILEYTVAKSLELMCYQDGMGAIDAIKFDNDKVVNLFKDIKAKEIAYYIYLKNIKIISKKEKISEVKKALLNFLSDVDYKNGLALFNIVNILKKI